MTETEKTDGSRNDDHEMKAVTENTKEEDETKNLGGMIVMKKTRKTIVRMKRLRFEETPITI